MSFHNKYNRKYFGLIFKILVSASLLGYLLFKVPVSNIYAAAASADIMLVLAAALLAVPVNYLTAYQMYYLTRAQGMEVSMLQIIKIQLVTNYYNLFLPGVISGVAVKWYKLSKYGSRSSSAAVVILNRFIQTFGTVLLGIFFLLPEVYKSHNIKTLYILTGLFLLLVFLYIFLFNKSINRILVHLLYKIPFPKIFRNKAHKFLMSMEQFHTLSFRDHMELNGVALVNNIIGIISFYYFAAAIHIDLSIITLGWIRSALSIVSLLPFSFAGFGIREGSLILMLGQYGVHAHTAIVLSFLFFLRNLINAFIGGILEIMPASHKIVNRVSELP